MYVFAAAQQTSTAKFALVLETFEGEWSILDLLFFNCFISYLFWFVNKSEIWNYTDCKTLYFANENIVKS